MGAECSCDWPKIKNAAVWPCMAGCQQDRGRTLTRSCLSQQMAAILRPVTQKAPPPEPSRDLVGASPTCHSEARLPEPAYASVHVRATWCACFVSKSCQALQIALSDDTALCKKCTSHEQIASCAKK